MFKVLRRGSSRFFLLVTLVLLLITLCLYYVGLSNSFSLTNSLSLDAGTREDELPVPAAQFVRERGFGWVEGDSSVNGRTCPDVRLAKSDVDTVEEFGKFNFQVRKCFYGRYSFFKL